MIAYFKKLILHETPVQPIQRGSENQASSDSYKKNDVLGQRYEVHSVLGKGGFGIVYLVYDHDLHSVVALKTFHDEYLADKNVRERFNKEANIWIALDRHPYIVRAYLVDEIAGRLYISMEYIPPDEDGINTLEEYLCSRQPDLIQSIRWAIQFCTGMEYAYSKGISAHRDIKPSNIMITQDKVIKISDFGLSGLVGALESHHDDKGIEKRSLLKTNIGSIFGTPTHMSPEQFIDAASCDERSDIYSFGIVLYQMVSGNKLPFYTDNQENFWQIFKHLHTEESFPTVDSPLFPIIQRCLEKKPERRYQSFKELKSELETILEKQFHEVFTPMGDEQFDASAINNKGTSFLILHRYNEALKCFNQAIEILPLFAKAWNNKGSALSSLGRTEEALQSWRKAIELDPQLARAWYNIGNKYRLVGNLKDAIKYYDKSIALEPSYIPAWNNKAIIYIEDKNYDAAIKCLDKAIELDPKAPLSWYNKGFSFYELKNYKQAIQCFLVSVKLNPLYVSAWNYLGLSYWGRKETEKALNCFDKALEIDQDYIYALRNKAFLLDELEK